MDPASASGRPGGQGREQDAEPALRPEAAGDRLRPVPAARRGSVDAREHDHVGRGHGEEGVGSEAVERGIEKLERRAERVQVDQVERAAGGGPASVPAERARSPVPVPSRVLPQDLGRGATGVGAEERSQGAALDEHPQAADAGGGEHLPRPGRTGGAGRARGRDRDVEVPVEGHRPVVEHGSSTGRSPRARGLREQEVGPAFASEGDER